MDAAVILILATLVAKCRNGFNWVMDFGWKNVPFLLIAGGAVAIIFEYRAFEYEAWEYAENMPVVPYLLTDRPVALASNDGATSSDFLYNRDSS